MRQQHLLVLTVAYLASRAVLHYAGLRFAFSLDWMWMADAGDLEDRLAETLYYFHAFPPGMNVLTGLLLKASETHAGTLAWLVFLALGVAQVNGIAYLATALGVPRWPSAALALAFSLTPPAIYFEHLYLYEWPVTTLLVFALVGAHRAVVTGSTAWWCAAFATTAAVGATRSTFHLAWMILIVVMAAAMVPAQQRRRVRNAALIPLAVLTLLYAKNEWLVGEFAASTFGPASFHLVTVDRLPKAERDAAIRRGMLSPFAAISAYAPPRRYLLFFASPDLRGWPASITRLDQVRVKAPNFNHWFLLKVHDARRRDAARVLVAYPLNYIRSVVAGLLAFSSPSTMWHPATGTSRSPHAQHRAVLGAYEDRYNAVVHGGPLAPVGLYALVPLLLLWGVWRTVTWWRRGGRDTARALLLALLLFQIAYVTAASTMLTFLESSRYRFQIEPCLWLLAAAAVADALSSWTERRWTST
ncbi:MAG: hypothetical protein IT178_08125 [Acidobacteria bacterium]|nr:hypothetical protein [Acidobacteriota bacterium]